MSILLIKSMMGVLLFVYIFLYHFRVSSFILDLMVGQLPNLSMFSFDIIGKANIFLMNFVWFVSQIFSALSVAEMVAVCPYSKSGRMKVW